jgi:hypothetical protein
MWLEGEGKARPSRDQRNFRGMENSYLSCARATEVAVEIALLKQRAYVLLVGASRSVGRGRAIVPSCRFA